MVCGSDTILMFTGSSVILEGMSTASQCARESILLFTCLADRDDRWWRSARALPNERNGHNLQRQGSSRPRDLARLISASTSRLREPISSLPTLA